MQTCVLGNIGMTKPDACTEAEVVGPLCHPDRFGGYAILRWMKKELPVKGPGNPVERYPIEFDFESRRYGCPRIEPCTPTTACAAGNVCTEGYVNYYELSVLKRLFMKKAMTILEGLTLKSGLRSLSASGPPYPTKRHMLCTSMQPMQPKTHFRLDGLANHAQKYHG